MITKTHPTLVVAELADLGHRSFGENKDQEARPKAMELDVLRPGINFDWHFVGQLQSNKVKSAMSYAKTIHSLDRPSLLKEIAKQLASSQAQIDCYIELNLTQDLNRGGLDPSMIRQFAESALEVPGLRVLGVMAVAGLDVDPRVDFQTERLLFPLDSRTYWQLQSHLDPNPINRDHVTQKDQYQPQIHAAYSIPVEGMLQKPHWVRW